MKLILAIVSDDDKRAVTKALHKQSFGVTILSSTGSFLSMGNTTLMIGCDDDQVDQAIETIKSESKRRTKIVPTVGSSDLSQFSSSSIEVPVGGATIFVLNVEQFIKA